MDILKELQLFDDAPNDGEINTLLGEGVVPMLELSVRQVNLTF